ncbi:MAG: hypothetical protein U1E89_00625 [Burkholderiaceae bacterium]
MHLIVPFAAAASAAARAAAHTLALPQLEKLLAQCVAGAALGGHERTLTAPHELALAQALGWSADDGALPWAARAAAREGVAVGTEAWGLLTPVHLHLGTEQVSLTDPDALELDAAASRELFAALEPLAAADGVALYWGSPLRWYAAHASLERLPTASLDRVIGRHIDAWLPEAPAARLMRRLQSEAQMLWHAHPVNQQREAAELPVVNSFWLSGCGIAQPVIGAEPVVDDRLRRPALGEDWAAWREAWHALDAGPIAQLLAASEGTRLTLAGERRAVTYTRVARPWWRRWQRHAAHAVLEAL